MIKEIVQQWEANKHKLAEYFRNTLQEEYGDYDIILKKLFELCLHDVDGELIYDIEQMTKIDNGDYEGTIIYLIPQQRYVPRAEHYLVTFVYYGSCSGCDTLQGIHGYDRDFPSEEQVKQYMILALHLVQKMKWLYSEEETE